MKQNKHIVILAAALGLAACNRQALPEGPGAAIGLDIAAAGLQTRAVQDASALQDAVFSGGRTLHAWFGGDRCVDGSNLSLDETTLTVGAGGTSHDGYNWQPVSLSPQLYLRSGEVSVRAHAAHPATVTRGTASFAVQRNQHTAEAYVASDLMYGSGTVSRASSADPSAVGGLVFSHLMTKVRVKLTPRGGVHVKKVKLTAGVVRQALSWAGDVPSPGALGDEEADRISAGNPVVLYDGDTGAFLDCAALLPAQTLGGPVLTVETDAGSVSYSVASTALESGQCHTLELTLSPLDAGVQVAYWTDENQNALESHRHLYTVGGVTFRMVKVEGGAYDYHDWVTAGGFPVYGSVSGVLADYYMAETETTQALYQAVVGSLPSINDNYKGGSKPVLNITYSTVSAADGFLSKLNEMTEGQRPAGWSFKVPTPEQFRWAFEGGKYSHGYRFSGSDLLETVAWHQTPSYSGPKTATDGYTRDVATLLPNELGLYDMSGNVCEMAYKEGDIVYWMGGSTLHTTNAPHFEKNFAAGCATSVANNTFGFRVVLSED